MLEHSTPGRQDPNHDDPSLPRRPTWDCFNHLLEIPRLSNRYIAIRHGKSEANAAGIHSGDPAIGAVAYPLTEDGADGVRASIAEAIASGRLNGDVVIVSSGYLRAAQTAAICAEALGGAPIETDPALGERGAGAYEGRRTTLEEKKELLRRARELDQHDPFHSTDGFESPVSVLERASLAILEIEKRHSGKLILLVSHHDTIQILRTAFAKIHPAESWSMPGVRNAQMVELEIGRDDRAPGT